MKPIAPILLFAAAVTLLAALTASAQPGSGDLVADPVILVRDASGSLERYEPQTQSDGTVIYVPAAGERIAAPSSGTWVWGLFLFGLLGQAMFMGRFLLQWWVSERLRKSVIPVGFWWLSLIGSLMLFAYFLLRLEPIGMLGQCMGMPIYARNLYFVIRDRRVGTLDEHDPAENPVADPNAEI